MPDQKYLLTYTVAPGPVTKDELAEGYGGTDALLMHSILFGEDGSRSEAIVDVDGRTGEGLPPAEWHKCWTVLTQTLADREDLATPEHREFFQACFDRYIEKFHPSIALVRELNRTKPGPPNPSRKPIRPPTIEDVRSGRRWPWSTLGPIPLVIWPSPPPTTKPYEYRPVRRLKHLGERKIYYAQFAHFFPPSMPPFSIIESNGRDLADARFARNGELFFIVENDDLSFSAYKERPINPSEE